MTVHFFNSTVPACLRRGRLAIFVTSASPTSLVHLSQEMPNPFGSFVTLLNRSGSDFGYAQVLERAMSAELTHHLGGRGSGNNRNGESRQTVPTDFGAIEVETPRDRNGSFEPQILPKHERRFAGFDQKILSMYARGMSTRDIQGNLEEIYAVEVGPSVCRNQESTFGEKRSGSGFNAAQNPSSNSVTEILRSRVQTSGERPSSIRRTKQSRDRGGRPKRRRSSAGSNRTSSAAFAEFVRCRSVDLTASIRRLRRDTSSQASIPSSTAVSAVVVSHPRSKAAQNAVLTVPSIVPVSMNINPSDALSKALLQSFGCSDTTIARMSRS